MECLFARERVQRGSSISCLCTHTHYSMHKTNRQTAINDGHHHYHHHHRGRDSLGKRGAASQQQAVVAAVVVAINHCMQW